jgi:hypothetical protein
MIYEKQFVKSDGRKLNRSGPRDMQARTSGGTTDADLIKLLTDEITDLKAKLLSRDDASKVPSGYYSPEQMDEEIRKAVEAAVSEVAGSKNKDVILEVNEYKSRIYNLQANNENLTRLRDAVVKENEQLKERLGVLESQSEELVELKQQVSLLKQELVGKQEVIDILKTKPAVIDSYNIVEQTDPDRPKMEQAFVDPLEDNAGDDLKPSISVDQIIKENTIDDQVDKLRNLIGKLPD